MIDELRGMIVPVDARAAIEVHAIDLDAPQTSDLLTDWGWIGLMASERGLRLLTLPSATRAAALRALRYDYPEAGLIEYDPAAQPTIGESVGSGAETLLQAAAQQVRAYLAGDLRDFTVPLDLRGHTSFALTVWATALRIPYAQTRTYAWVAQRVGGSGQGIYQAVGAALGSNPIPLIIPCHRVIGSDGSLHGYAGGLAMKTRLLALETGQARLLL